MEIESYVSRDLKHPTTRAALVAVTGLHDRAVRQEIANARRRGVPIVGLLSGGYYITSSPVEWNAFVDQQRRRALATFERSGLAGNVQFDGQTGPMFGGEYD